jgi:hypothetical protein
MQKDAIDQPGLGRIIARRKPRPLTARLWSRVDMSAGPEGCWLWQGSVNDRGYGQIRAEPVGNAIRGIKTTTHRAAWTLTHGPIPEGMGVCHRCDNPRCANPSHLWLGTHTENLGDMKSKGRAARGDRSGTARLNSKQVRVIRKLLQVGSCSQSELAVLANVSCSSINNIKNKTTWGHLDA